MNINDAFPSNYLKASDLGEAQPVVTIERLEIEPVGRGKEMKPVIYFAGKQKGMVLNKTNSKKIAEIAGSTDTDDWHGIQIKLYSTEVDFQGETVEAIRVKSPQATKAKSKPKPAPVEVEDSTPDYDDSEVPF